MGSGVRSKRGNAATDFRLNLAIIRRGDAQLAGLAIRLLAGRPVRPSDRLLIQGTIGAGGHVQLSLRKPGAGFKVLIELHAVDARGHPRDSQAALDGWRTESGGATVWELSSCVVANVYPLSDEP